MKNFFVLCALLYGVIECCNCTCYSNTLVDTTKLGKKEVKVLFPDISTLVYFDRLKDNSISTPNKPLCFTRKENKLIFEFPTSLVTHDNKELIMDYKTTGNRPFFSTRLFERYAKGNTSSSFLTKKNDGYIIGYDLHENILLSVMRETSAILTPSHIIGISQRFNWTGVDLIRIRNRNKNKWLNVHASNTMIVYKYPDDEFYQAKVFDKDNVLNTFNYRINHIEAHVTNYTTLTYSDIKGKNKIVIKDRNVLIEVKNVEESEPFKLTSPEGAIIVQTSNVNNLPQVSCTELSRNLTLFDGGWRVQQNNSFIEYSNLQNLIIFSLDGGPLMFENLESLRASAYSNELKAIINNIKHVYGDTFLNSLLNARLNDIGKNGILRVKCHSFMISVTTNGNRINNIKANNLNYDIEMNFNGSFQVNYYNYEINNAVQLSQTLNSKKKYIMNLNSMSVETAKKTVATRKHSTK